MPVVRKSAYIHACVRIAVGMLSLAFSTAILLDVSRMSTRLKAHLAMRHAYVFYRPLLRLELHHTAVLAWTLGFYMLTIGLALLIGFELRRVSWLGVAGSCNWLLACGNAAPAQLPSYLFCALPPLILTALFLIFAFGEDRPLWSLDSWLDTRG